MGIITPPVSAREKAGTLDEKTQASLEALSGPEKRRYYRKVQRVNAKAAAKAAVPRPTLPNAREWFDIYMRHAGQIPDEVAAE